jgi:hypothetical protein
MIRRMKRASWVVVAVAALASIATSAPRWQLDAIVPAHASPTPTQVLHVVIESSRPPTLECTGAFIEEAVPLDGTAAHGTYSCPPAQDLLAVRLTGIDGTGGGLFCGGPRKPPDGTFVRVVSIDSATRWTKDVELHLDHPSDALVQVSVASRYAFTASATYTLLGATTLLHTEVYLKHVNITQSGDPGGAIDLVVTLYGTCTAEPCTPPADATATLELVHP